MERIWHHNKPAKRGPPSKTHGPGKEGINQRGNKETKVTPKELQSSTAEIGVSVHRTIKPYTPQSWALRKSGQKKAIA
jgi:hypothetical protein